MWSPGGMRNLQIQPKRLPHPSGGCCSGRASATRWALLHVSSSLSAAHLRRLGSGCARYLCRLRPEPNRMLVSQTWHTVPPTELSTFKMLTALRSRGTYGAKTEALRLVAAQAKVHFPGQGLHWTPAGTMFTR